jgi:putative peptidoglycan lipid II flippase
MNANGSSANRQIARAAGTVMVAFVLSNLTGLIRQILVARAFGTQAQIEAFNTSNRVAETLFYLVAGGALASAFIPTFTAILTRGDRQRAWRLASAVGNLVLIVLTLAAIIVEVAAPWVVRHVLAPGFAVDPEKELLTISLLRLMLPSAIIFGLSALVMGILNSHQVFFYPALAPSMYQLGMIFGVVVLSPRLGIYGLAWGVLLGAALHLALQLPSLFRLKGQYFATLGLDMAEVGEVARLMGPRLLGVAVVQLNFWINTRLASQFVEGSVTGVVLGFTLMLMPQAAIAQSIAIAAMPTFSRQVALGKLNEMRGALAASLRGAILLSLPASFGLMLLRRPVVALLYQRGEFNAFSTELVAWALLWYAAGLVGHSIVEILSRAFYSLHDTKTPVMIGVLAMSLNVILSYLFSNLFEGWGWLPLGGLAFANSLATALEAAGLFILMRQRLHGLEGRALIVGFAQALAATLGMSAFLWYWVGWTSSINLWLVVLGGIIVGAFIYGCLAFLFGVKELRLIFSVLRRRAIR